MLPLDSPTWANLEHAYGSAADIPNLLRQLDAFPTGGSAEPWSSIWSALAHQGDVYSASFAAVPHVIQVLSIAPEKASWEYFQFPVWVEICRQRQKIAVPAALSPPYFESLKMLTGLVCAVIDKEWNADFLGAALSALALSKGFTTVAEAVQELSPDVADAFLNWNLER